MNPKKLNINDTPKWFKVLSLVLPLILTLFLVQRKLNNDFYFLYPTGEYLVTNHFNFPQTDFLSMHSTMSITVQQWLSTVVFYFIYSHFGEGGIFALTYVCAALFYLISFKLCLTISNNFFVSAMCSFLSSAYISSVFITSRPQIFSFLIILLELLVLEKFVKTGKWTYLIALPLLSLAMINFHSSMWLLLFVFLAPYFVQSIPIKIGKIKQSPCCSFIQLFIAAVVSFAVGFINPYGFKAMTYIFSSYGYEEINNFIGEMASPAANSVTGWIFFIVVGVLSAVSLLYKKRKFQTRFVLLYLGTLVLALTSYKSTAFFIIAGFPAASYCLSEFSFDLKISNQKANKKTIKLRATLSALVIVMLGVLIFVTTYNYSNDYEPFFSSIQSQSNTNKSLYNVLDNVVEILDNVKDKNSIVLYTGFDNGPYMEFNGYHPYIDCRAELFLKDNNGEYDYMAEIYHLSTASIYYKDFLNRYNFNYLIVQSGEEYLYSSLIHDDDYEIVYTSEFGNKNQSITLFKLKVQNNAQQN
jgi:hypothetical protein